VKARKFPLRSTNMGSKFMEMEQKGEKRFFIRFERFQDGRKHVTDDRRYSHASASRIDPDVDTPTKMVKNYLRYHSNRGSFRSVFTKKLKIK
jgi:hypothetical protein